MNLAKLKAAFEVIECDLLLLRTYWLSKFCSCGLHRRRLTTEQHEYLSGAKGREYDNPKECCWCQYMPNPTLPLRYLVLLLVGIALGQPFNDLRACLTPQGDLSEDFSEPSLLGFPSVNAPPVEYLTLA